MTSYQGNPRDRLVHLEMVDLFNITPPPDKAVQGALAKTLKIVGSKGKHAVRARMITSVSNTKFTTLDGDPISLVGLHGKGEILAMGPAWAIERLAEGTTPNYDEEVSHLERDLELYKGLAAGARAPADARLQDRRVSNALREINGYDEVRRTAVLAFFDSVIGNLETFIADCKSQKIAWWFFWSSAYKAKLKEIGLPDREEISWNDNLLDDFDLRESTPV